MPGKEYKREEVPNPHNKHAEETNDQMNITPSYGRKHKGKMLKAFPRVGVGKIIQNELQRRQKQNK
mgnify:CR=1 FL=1